MMTRRSLGDLEVSAIGLGCMGMSEFYGETDESEALSTIDRALELGVTLLDTADMYGPFTNEVLVGRAIRGRRDKIVLATKCGIVRDEQGGFRGLNGTPDYIKASCDASLRRLQVDVIDLYHLHRVDPQTPIEESVGALADLVRAGKVRYIGLSEAGDEILRRAHRVHPITSLQSEYSLWSREVENDVLKTCEELRIGFLAYSPLGRGMLTGRVRSLDTLAANDYRRTTPRFQGSNFEKNQTLVRGIEALAERASCTPAQLALGWLLSRQPFIVPIPGTKRHTYLAENVQATQLVLSREVLQSIDELMPVGVAAGKRYP